MKIKAVRELLGMTQKDVAEKMNTTQQTIARWETGKTKMNVDQIKNLCLVLHCTADILLETDPDPAEWRGNPFAVSDNGTPYGTLRLQVAGEERNYPIDDDAVKSLKCQFGIGRTSKHRKNTTWIQSQTMDNKLLMINPAYLEKVSWISDNVNEMPGYEHPEVYRALETVDLEPGEDGVIDIADLSGEMKRVCEEIVKARTEEEVGRMASHITIVYGDGSSESAVMDEAVGYAISALEMDPPESGRDSFLLTYQEAGYETELVNLRRVALIEIPSSLYFRLTAS
ncbi:helix-turn-helix transcriptional regulator (plasmid) [Pseudohalocynthiibacter aestuariivivens]|nr:helix-turn-helix transcriptional regulator [Pseudohalocynthiibacter aestuariivivens]QIE47756.1 helix-turn-helix transcriptional regulator [Pseudohalocynthiibacter aestuariivivens]